MNIFPSIKHLAARNDVSQPGSDPTHTNKKKIKVYLKNQKVHDLIFMTKGLNKVVDLLNILKRKIERHIH